MTPSDAYNIPAKLVYQSTPVGSISALPRERRRPYEFTVFGLPRNIQSSIWSPNTGAFLRGLMKQFRLPIERTPELALIVLRVFLGEVPVAELGAALSSDLKMANDQAQAMAREIEKELLTPVMLELNTWLGVKKKAASAGASASQAGAQNVVDLKNPKSQ